MPRHISNAELQVTLVRKSSKGFLFHLSLTFSALVAYSISYWQERTYIMGEIWKTYYYAINIRSHSHMQLWI